MSNSNNTMNTRNQKSFKTLLASMKGTDFNIFPAKSGNGNYAFAFGDELRGYVSKPAMELMDKTAKECTKDGVLDNEAYQNKVVPQLQFAEVLPVGMPEEDAEGNSNWIPTLMAVGNRQPAKYSFNYNSLQ